MYYAVCLDGVLENDELLPLLVVYGYLEMH